MKIKDIPRLMVAGAALACLAYIVYNAGRELNLIKGETFVKLKPEAELDEVEKNILNDLKARPGMVHIGPSGKTLFGITQNAFGDDLLLSISGPDFNKMSPAEINEFIQKTLEN